MKKLVMVVTVLIMAILMVAPVNAAGRGDRGHSYRRSNDRQAIRSDHRGQQRQSQPYQQNSARYGGYRGDRGPQADSGRQGDRGYRGDHRRSNGNFITGVIVGSVLTSIIKKDQHRQSEPVYRDSDGYYQPVYNDPSCQQPVIVDQGCQSGNQSQYLYDQPQSGCRIIQLEAHFKYEIWALCADGSYKKVISFALNSQKNLQIKDSVGGSKIIFRQNGKADIATYKPKDIDGNRILCETEYETCRPQPGDSLELL